MSKNSGASFGMTKMPSYTKNTSTVPPLKLNTAFGSGFKEMKNELENKYSVPGMLNKNSDNNSFKGLFNKFSSTVGGASKSSAYLEEMQKKLFKPNK
jgi:hypothetical protein